jgi:hypothetical protein
MLLDRNQARQMHNLPPLTDSASMPQQFTAEQPLSGGDVPPQQPPMQGFQPDLSQQTLQQMELTTLGLLNHIQDVLKGGINMFDKQKYVTPLVQSVNQIYSLVLSAKQNGTDPQAELQLKKQELEFKHALDMMAHQHDVQMAEKKMELEQMKAEMKMHMEQQKAELQARQSEEQHQASLEAMAQQSQMQAENNNLEQATKIQQAQQNEESHQQTMSIAKNKAKQDEIASKDAGSKV